MKVIEVTNKIKEIPLFKDFKWSEPKEDSHYGSLEVGNENFRDNGKDEYNLGFAYHIFVAHMYKGERGREFFYLIVHRPSTVREFRKHNAVDLEYNKIYASGSTVKKVVRPLEKYIEKGYTLK